VTTAYSTVSFEPVAVGSRPDGWTSVVEGARPGRRSLDKVHVMAEPLHNDTEFYEQLGPVVAEVQRILETTEEHAKSIVYASEPLWEALEAAGGNVDSWGFGEFSWLFPKVCAFIRATANP
jgi:hypothetical protein